MRLGNIFDEVALFGDRHGFVPPSAERLLSFDARLANRIRVNAWLLATLPKAAAR